MIYKAPKSQKESGRMKCQLHGHVWSSLRSRPRFFRPRGLGQSLRTPPCIQAHLEALLLAPARCVYRPRSWC